MNLQALTRWIRRHSLSWLASLALHLSILGPLCLITWAVTVNLHSQAALNLTPLPANNDFPGDTSDDSSPDVGFEQQGDEVGGGGTLDHWVKGSTKVPRPGDKNAPADANTKGGAGGNNPKAGGSGGNSGVLSAGALASAAAPIGAAKSSALMASLDEMPIVGGDVTAGAGDLGYLVTARAGTGRGIGMGTGVGVGNGSEDGATPGKGGLDTGFRPLIDNMRGKGLDIVLVLDATDSMTPYIEQSKKRLNDVINITRGLIPNARFGVVAFKDYGDDYGPNACRFTKITDKIEDIRKFLDTIVAGGGGDIPEPIHEALAIAGDKKTMGWMEGRKNVIILVSDAPVHASHRQDAYLLARQFAAGRLLGTINVIDTGGTGTGDASTRRNAPVQDLKQISTEGKGSIFLLDDEEAFYRHLIISVFGERYRQDVETIIGMYVKAH